MRPTMWDSMSKLSAVMEELLEVAETLARLVPGLASPLCPTGATTTSSTSLRLTLLLLLLLLLQPLLLLPLPGHRTTAPPGSTRSFIPWPRRSILGMRSECRLVLS